MAKGSAECRHLKSWSTEKTDRGVFWIPDDSPATKRFPEHKVSEEEESLLTNWLQAAYEEEQDLKSTTAPRVHAQLVAGEETNTWDTETSLSPGYCLLFLA